MATIALRWDRPTYSGHLYTEIWRAASQLADTLTATVEAGATEIGESIGSVFFDTGRTAGDTYWYYIRHVNTNGEAGAFTEREQAAEKIGTADLADDAVTFAKLQNIAADRLLGRTTAGAGSIEELTAAEARAALGLGSSALKDTGLQGDKVPLLNSTCIWSNDDQRFTGIPAYADDAAAGSGGLVAGRLYKTATGELRIKT